MPTKVNECNEAMADPIMLIDLPGKPVTAVPTHDGCWIFVSLIATTPGSQSNVAVLKRLDGKISVVRIVPVNGRAFGNVLTNDGKLLIIASDDSVAFLDTERLESGLGDPVLGYWKGDVISPGHFYVNVTADDQYLFVSDEKVQTISVIDLAKARTSAFTANSLVGKIPVGRLPIALTFSADGRYLFTTSQEMSNLDWQIECKSETATDSNAKPGHAQGAILVVDVEQAKSDPAKSVVAIVPAGCNPVRLVTSPKGDIAYVTARGSNELLIFDTSKLTSDPTHAFIGKVQVGTAPVGIAVIDGGKKIIVTNSNRFAGGVDDRQSLTVIDAAKISGGAGAILGSIPAGAFPREMRVTSDGRTLLLTNFNSRTLQIIDLNRLPIQR